MLIRQETKEDYAQICDLVKTAFSTIEHSDGNEQNLVTALRNSEAFVPGLSLVAEIDGRIAGHIMFTEGKVGQDTVLVLAPLSVLPEYQQQGIGTALIAEGHKAAQALGYQYSLVLGSEQYYPRSGYIPARRLGIEVPVGMPDENFMAIKLQENAKPIKGAVTYAKEFGI
ncbi:putative N-acetyltransferase YhbS [Desulfitobacterium sp. LBE]|uniref:GNAT family N-acetyltransferase n=1 Tax=Desulfitobacterium sp. LBE TaxID=884086 RepID=UPI001199BED1|nr:N-acetyltransferase [Desulfitobacterium sp. LBE]TWH56701.1 putative N-acetyltransferase YhbS [Desulfitobacterium sp. LBE]